MLLDPFCRALRSAARVCCGLAALVLIACGPHYGDAFLKSFRAGQRAVAAGRYAEAAERFTAASRVAKRLKDRDEARFLCARMFERMQRWDEAKASYQALIDESPTGPRTGRAEFKLAYLEIQHGDAARGWQALREVILRRPSHGAVHHAVSELRDHLLETEGEEELQRLFRHWQSKLRGEEIAQQIHYEIGRSLQRVGKLREAHAQLLQAARLHPYPQGSWTDDALWHASLVAERIGDYQLAIRDLRELLHVREESSLGSYERPRFPKAQMRIAELYRDRVGDLDAARREFRLMYEDHGASVLADDAMWQEALLSLQLEDPKRACSLALELDERFPDSRYRRCAGAICPKLASRKPVRECPAYIRRTMPSLAGQETPGDES